MARPLRPWHLAALLAAAVFLVYGRAIPHPFVYDDRWFLTENPALERVAPISRFFLDRESVAAPAMGMGSTIYRPVPTLSFALDNAAGNLKPARLRLENLLLHGGAGAAALGLFMAMGISPAGAAFGAALFLFHPAQVETVAWVTQRSNLLCTLGLLLAFWAYRRRRWGWAAAAYALALLSKETAVMAVFLLPFFDLAEPRRAPRWAGVGAAGAMAAAYAALRWSVVGPPAQRAEAGTLGGNLLTGAASGLEYIKLILAPLSLRVSHRHYVDDPMKSTEVLVGLVLAAALAAACVLLWRRKHRRAAFFLAWVPVTLAPVLGFFQTDTFVAERFLYTALLGVAGLGALRWESMKGGRRRILWVVPAFWAVLAFAQTEAWKSELALWTHAVAEEPDNAFAQLCRAQALVDEGRRREGEAGYRRALELGLTRPQAAAALTNLSRLRLMDGAPQESLSWADKALKADPRSLPAMVDRAIALAMLGRRAEALEAVFLLETTAPPKEQWAPLRKRVEGISEGAGTP